MCPTWSINVYFIDNFKQDVTLPYIKAGLHVHVHQPIQSLNKEFPKSV